MQIGNRNLPRTVLSGPDRMTLTERVPTTDCA